MVRPNTCLVGIDGGVTRAGKLRSVHCAALCCAFVCALLVLILLDRRAVWGNVSSSRHADSIRGILSMSMYTD
ncbi:hypothetical protein BDW42DRAFT_177426 [Aspergillus taichungensis]|uniref:Uncharacterized protein n=1 Tax=Aspergillus taichungensis TaxID=482145 RepID=A0A2J5HJ80_9EURO|nr:hypothetical protein BDW42DRAFT_177426 [Aspergillus taichungensis]